MYLFAKLTKRMSASSIDKLFEHTFKNPAYRLIAVTTISFIILFLFGAKSFETSIGCVPNSSIFFILNLLITVFNVKTLIFFF
mgnify:CR=1 FL=1